MIIRRLPFARRRTLTLYLGTIPHRAYRLWGNLYLISLPFSQR
jgi:hypothetical protein